MKKTQLVKQCQSICLFIVNLLLINYSYNSYKRNIKTLDYYLNTELFNIINQNNNLAFNVFLKAKSKSFLDTNQVVCQEIVINGIDNYKLQDKLRSLLEIPITQDQIISSKNIEKLVSRMKLSGFFTNIDIYNQCINHHQTIYINVTINPICKSIRLLDFHTKLVPESYTISLFKMQIGYPINFLEIDKSINLLKNWYHSRGYKYAKVFTSNSESNSSIVITISEGIIASIEIKGYHKDYDNKRLSDNRSISLILNALKIKPNKLFNMKYIDNGILKLKNKKVILHCNYEIIQLQNEKLKLLLDLELLDDRYTYLFSKNILITSSLLESMELLLHYSLNHLFYNYNYIETPIFNRIPNFIANQINSLFHPIYFSMSDYDQAVYQILIPSNIIEWPYINEWLLTQLFFITGDNFGFRHYMRNVNNDNSNYLLDIRFPRTGLYFNLKYEQPLIHVYNKIFSEWYIRLYKDTYTFQKKLIPVLLDQLNDSMFYYKNSILFQTGFSFECKHHINKYMNIIKNITFKKLTSQYLLLNNFTNWTQLNIKSNSNYINTYYSYFKQIWIQNIEEFLQLDLDIISNQRQTRYNATESIIQLVSFIPKKIHQSFNQFPIKLNYGNKIRLRINSSFNIMNNIFNCESELLTFIGRVKSLPSSEILWLLGPDIVRGYAEAVFPLPLNLSKIKLEYHIKLARSNTIFIFLDYAKNAGCISKFKFNYSLFPHCSSDKFDEFQIRVGYGIGLRIKTSVKQIPPLRLEYGFNIHNGHCLHLRFNKQ